MANPIIAIGMFLALIAIIIIFIYLYLNYFQPEPPKEIINEKIIIRRHPLPKEMSFYETEEKELTDTRDLNQLEVECGHNEVLSEVKLVKNNDANFEYRYKCKPAYVSDIKQYYTQWRDDGKGDVKSLQTHNLDCFTTDALLSFRLERNPIDATKSRYNYRCGKAGVKSAEDAHTPWQYDRAGKIDALLDHDCKCPNNGAMTQLQLNQNDEQPSLGKEIGQRFQRPMENQNEIRYSYRCEVNDPPGTTRHSTEWNSDGEGDTRYLDRHQVVCPTGAVLTQFELERDIPKNVYRYNYLCKKAKVRGSIDLNTGWDYDGNGDVLYLDKRNVQCPENYALNQFYLIRNPTNATQYRYNYTCYDVGIQDTKINFTPWNADDEGSATYLDRHDMRCPNNGALSHFKMDRVPNDIWKYRFEYECENKFEQQI